MAAGRGTQRIQSKLEGKLQEGKFYEAHQMYRTLYFRYKSQEKYAEAIDLLYNGSVKLANYNQIGSGADLAVLLVMLLADTKTAVSEHIIDKLGHLHRLMDDTCPERSAFVNRSIRWTTDQDESNKSGHPNLHQSYALNLWKERNYHQSRYHFIRSRDGESCATMLVEYHVRLGYPSEVDLFIAQAVFQYLCLQNKPTAETAFKSYTKKHPQVEQGPPFVRPLLNFLWMLLLAIEGGKVTVFTVLVEKYQPTLARDPTYREYLDRIGQLFFGLAPPPTNQGLFGNLLESLFATEPDTAGRGAGDNEVKQMDLD